MIPLKYLSTVQKSPLFFVLSLLLVIATRYGHTAQGSAPVGRSAPSQVPLEISNNMLTVRFDQVTQRFSATDRFSGKTFITDGQLEGEVVQAEQTPHVIKAVHANGSFTWIELRDSIPFLLIRKTMINPGTATLDINKAVPAIFNINLGQPLNNLKTMGTAGLTSPDKNPGSYLFLTCADPATRNGVVAGWVTQNRGSGVIFSSIKTQTVEFKAQIDYGHLLIPMGQSANLETLAVGYFPDARIGQELYADAIKKEYNIKLHPQMTGYCTWYSEIGGLTDPKGGAGASNEKDIKTLTEFAVRELKPFGFDFVQIDDEWQDGATHPDGSRINGPRRGFLRHKPNGPYPNGMAPTASMIKSHGLTAGIWFMPFSRNHQDPEYKNRQHWFMHRQDGLPYETNWGGTTLDLTQPEVQAHLTELARTIHGWGYNYFKMDGLWTGSCTEQVYVNDGYKEDYMGYHQPFHNPQVTNIEALRLGLKTLRSACGPDVFFSGCCASQSMRSLAGAIGLVDAMRIGPDNGFGWQDYRNETMHFEGGGIITGPIRGNRLYFLHGRVWWNDPDPAYVRPAVKLEHAQLLSSWVAISGTFNLNSDWLPGLPPERLDILKRCMPSHSAQARPVDYFDSPMPSIWLLSDSSQSVRRDVIALYNWDSAPATLTYNADKTGLDGTRTYHAFDYWNRTILPDFRGELKFDLPKESCRMIAVRPHEGHPVLVSTSRHVTQGIVDVSDETWLGSTLSAQSRLVANDPYEIRLAGLMDGKKWIPAHLSVSPEDAALGVKIVTIAKEELGWLRILITTPISRTVKWSVTFQ